MSRFRLFLLALMLCVAGGSLFLYKWQTLGFPLQPEEETRTWTVEVMAQFEAGPGPIKMNLHIPGLTPGFAILDENFVSRGFGFTTRYVSGGRQVQWAIRRARGTQTLFYRAVVYRDTQRLESDTTPPFPPVPQLEEPYLTATEGLVEQVAAQSADPASFATELLRRLGAPAGDQNIELLVGQNPDALSLARAATTLLAVQRIPSRVMHGVYLQERDRRSELTPWLEVHDGERWLYLNPVTGDIGLPRDFLIWWRGEEPLYVLDGGRNVDLRLSVQSNIADPLLVAQRRAQAWQSRVADFSLFSLPIQTQAVYAVLLMVPIGGLVIIFLRNIIGITTFGTFMPVLIALAFRETQLLGGILLFTVVVALGLAFRFVLENLRLLLVPRLTSVLVIVVLLMLMISIITQQLGIETGLSIALFPMVILTMTIERLSITWEERGGSHAFKVAVGTLIAATLAHLLMSIPELTYFVFTFPAVLLILVGFMLAMGRYRGYRLTELFRFKAFLKD